MPNSSASLVGKAMLAFGDLSLAAMIGDRRVLTQRVSDDRYFDADQIGLLGTERVDIVCHSLGDNNVAGPIVGSVGTA